MKNKFLISFLFFMHLLIICSCLGQKYDPEELKEVHLKDVASFKIGAGIDPNKLYSNVDYKNIVIKDFNSITPENSMKMNRLAPTENSMDWEEADSLVDFALSHNYRIHGHTLVWHRALPEWIVNFQGDADQWDNLLKRYIQKVVLRYKGKIHSWDVINEAIEEDGSYRKNIWYENIGEEYISKSFHYAHQADPSALLFYNEYGQENEPAKRESVKNLVTSLKEDGVPIHGVGLQLHTHVLRKNQELKTALKEMASTGLLVHISELTIAVNKDRSRKDFFQTPESLKEQMEKYSLIFKMYQSIVPKEKQYGITFWNVGDEDSYYPQQCNCIDYPQIFDTNYKKKDYYYKLVEALQQ